jgi:hypothetical protein
MSKLSPLSEFRSTLSLAREPGSKSLTAMSAKSAPAPLLITESRQAYKRMRRGLRKEIDPQGSIERMYLADIAYQEWEIRRWRRAKVALLNVAFRGVLRRLLAELMCGPDQEAWELDDMAKEMALAWFSDPEVQRRTAKRLDEYGLDATAIEARVLQQCCSELADFDRLLASAESRRIKAVRALAEYRASLSRHVTKNKPAPASEVANGRDIDRDKSNDKGRR